MALSAQDIAVIRLRLKDQAAKIKSLESALARIQAGSDLLQATVAIEAARRLRRSLRVGQHEDGACWWENPPDVGESAKAAIALDAALAEPEE